MRSTCAPAVAASTSAAADHWAASPSTSARRAVPGAVRAHGSGQSGAIRPGRSLAHRLQFPAQRRAPPGRGADDRRQGTKKKAALAAHRIVAWVAGWPPRPDGGGLRPRPTTSATAATIPPSGRPTRSACPPTTTNTTGLIPKAAARSMPWRPPTAPYASVAACWSANSILFSKNLRMHTARIKIVTDHHNITF